MKQVVKATINFSLFLLVLLTPLIAQADELPFTIDKRDHSKIEPVESDFVFGGLIGDIGSIAAPLYGWGIKVITILFVVGTLVMILSALFKNGQWQKYAQTTMLFTFLTMLLLRGMPIVVLSIKNAADFDALLHESLITLSNGAIYLAIISIAFSFVFRFGYQFIEHPEFHRWSKNLRSVAILMVIFSVGFPAIYELI